MTDHSAAPIAPLSTRDVDAWDDEADVIVVGLGAAGASAAITVAEAGGRALVLERTGGGGGTSALSGGLIYLGGGTSTQRDAGVEDDPDRMRAFLAACLGRDEGDERLRTYCDGSVEHHDWLVAHGVPFLGEFWPEPGMEPPGEAGLVYSGGEDAAPYRFDHEPVPRGHKPRTKGAAGGFLMECLLDTLSRTSAEVRTGARVERLVVDDDGAVVGVNARIDGTDRFLRATGGVVLCSGGWAYNEALVDAHIPPVNRVSFRIGTDNDDGWALRCAVGLGAAIEGMATAEVALPITPPRRMVRGILVNREGRRFVNEDTYFGHVGQEALLRQDGEVYMILDEPRYEVNRSGMRVTWVGATWGELEEEIGLPAGSLEATIAEYNAGAARGEDPAFGKAHDFLVPLDEPPFGAIDLRVGSAIYAGFPLGGVLTTIDGHVLSTDGAVRPGLFAAGRVASSLALERYCSGISLGESTFFGRRAGAAAARAALGAPA